MPQVVAWSLLGLILAAAVVMLIPPGIAIWILIVPLLLLPAGLTSAVLYGRGIQRTIAVGGAASAASPFLATLFFVLPFGFRGFFFSGGGFWLFIVALAPFICAPLGGVTAWLLQPRVRRRVRRRALQFKLSTMLWGMTAISVYLGLVSAAPISLVALMFGLLASTIPAALVTGIIDGRSRMRTFCIGGAAAGLVPQAIGLMTMLVSMGQYVGWANRGGPWGGYALELRIIYSIALFAPLALIFAGGYLALFVRRRLERSRVTFGAR